ncbi:hypothetical protein [Rhodococcus sp. BH5]|uniref:hypothetical protein n=1 Tax=Rhodococcus sp. BH5 TaxID=2871702 RepID=UPI0022CD3CAB|nr:hypothetical protein [Rhodococcus sp. BH5]MCZ9633418.1 hypothetical protein [Rhodococcus sp. BH5]
MINKKKVQRLWREEGLRVKVRKIRKRASAGVTSITEDHAQKVLRANDFQFDSTTDGRKFKIASMVDEQTRRSGTVSGATDNLSMQQAGLRAGSCTLAAGESPGESGNQDRVSDIPGGRPECRLDRPIGSRP